MGNNGLDYTVIGNKCESGRVIPKAVQALIDKKHSFVEFEVGDFVWAVLTKDRCPVGKFNKLAGEEPNSWKIGPLEIVEKMNSNVYRLKLPSHIQTSEIFHVKHLVLFQPGEEPNSEDDEDPNSRANSCQLEKDDADKTALRFLERWHRMNE